MQGRHQPGFWTGFALLLPITLSTMAIVLLAPILPGLLAEFAAVPGHDYWVPMILTVPALCVALLSPVAGLLGDRFGRRRLLVVALAVYGVVGVAPVFLHGLWPILASRIGVGVTEALIMVLSTTMIGDHFEGAARDRWLAAQTAFASLSALVFFNLGGQLGRIGWRAPFWVYAVALVMLALVLRFTRESTATPPVHGHAEAAPVRFPWRRMAGILAVTVYGSVMFYTVQIQAGRGLAVLGLADPGQIGFLTSVASIGVPIGTWIYARVGRLPVARLLLAEFALLTLGFALMGRAGAIAPFLAGCFVNQLGAGMLLPTLLVWAMRGLPFAVRGRGAGIWTGAFSIGQFLCPLVVSLASDSRGASVLVAFEVLAGAALAGALLALPVALRRAASMPVAAPAMPVLHG